MSDSILPPVTQDPPVIPPETGEPVVTDPINPNPSWADITSVLPDSLVEMVTPKLKAWDDGVNKKIQDMREQYEPLKKFEDYQEVDPQILQAGIALMQKLDNDPAEVVKILTEAYGLSAPPAVTEPVITSDPIDPDEQVDPRFETLAQQVQQLTDVFTKEQEQKQQLSQQEQLDNYMKSLHDKFDDKGPKWDEGYVLALIGQGVSGEAAVQQYQASVIEAAKALAAPPPPPPVVMGGSGGTVPASIDKPVSELSDKQTKDLVATILAQQAAQGS